MKDIYGLTDEEVIKSRQAHGANTLKEERRVGFFKRFFENLSDPIIKILLIALAIELVFTLGRCNLIEVFGIVLAILISTTVSTLSEYGSESAFLKLQSDNKELFCDVVRNGVIVKVPASELVIDDIVIISSGDKICADGIVVDGELTVDQSALNGEGREVEKKVGGFSGEWSLDSDSQLFYGSLVIGGGGMMRVQRVGEETFYGKVARDVQAQTRVSPLKLRLSKLAGQISKLGYVMAALVAITYLLFAFVVDNAFDITRIIASLSDYKSVIASLLHALTLMITVVVVAVPEGLPMMITVVLSANMKRMLRDSILVKKLVGIETAGSMNILFTDKTGTLTTGKLAVDRVITPSGTFSTPLALRKQGALFDKLLICAKFNTDTVISKGVISGGNTTDRAIAEFFKDEEVPQFKLKDKQSFTSFNKYSSVTSTDGVTYYKGAAERILGCCKYVFSNSGEKIAYDFSGISGEYRRATEKGERALAVAVSDGDSDDFCFVALIVLKDKLRVGVRESVKELTCAGIQLVMLTGDGMETAVAIAEEAGIYRRSSGHIAISSESLAKMPDDDVKEILPLIRVVSRALPSDKVRLVRISQAMNLVVGMTGDGINDAPSLKLADVGFAMGSGTEIAKSAGDIVILDDSVDAISKTVLYGRTIFNSIRKFITFQLIMNLAACGISLVGQFIGIETPITITQMLWVNIIMDTLGGLAFATEPPLRYYMKEPPKRRDEPLLTLNMIKGILALGGYTLLVCVLFLRLPAFRLAFGTEYGSERFLTAFYALFVFMGIFNCFLSRSERLNFLSNITKNTTFVAVMAVIAIVQVFMIYIGGEVFRTVPISCQDLFKVIALAFTTVAFEVIRRILVRLR